MLWRSSIVVCLVGASFLDTGCTIYDQSILENAKDRAATNKGVSGRGATRGTNLSEFLEPNIARAAAAGAAVMSDASVASAAMSPAPPAQDGGNAQGSRRNDTFADSDAGGLDELSKADAAVPPPMPEASSACRGRIGYVSPNGHCYFVFATSLSWHQSRDECQNLNAHLTTITSEGEQRFVASLQIQTETWIGLSRFGAANFSWLSNEELSFTSWEPEAPRPRQESAAVIVPSTGLWSDRAPNEPHPSLCEISND